MKAIELFTGRKLTLLFLMQWEESFSLQLCSLTSIFLKSFGLTYSSEEPGKMDRPVMIHRAVLGSIERMFVILTEHYKGKWPFWLSPFQVLICPVADRFHPYAEQVRARIHDARFYVDVETSDRTINKKLNCFSTIIY